MKIEETYVRTYVGDQNRTYRQRIDGKDNVTNHLLFWSQVTISTSGSEWVFVLYLCSKERKKGLGTECFIGHKPGTVFDIFLLN